MWGEPHSFQPRLSEFPQEEPRQKIPLRAGISRPGGIVMTIPSDLMNVAPCSTLEQTAGISTTPELSLFSALPQRCLWPKLPRALAPGWLQSRRDLSLPAVLRVGLCGVASSMWALGGAYCPPTSVGVASSPLASAQAPQPAVCNVWATVLGALCSASQCLGSWCSSWWHIMLSAVVEVLKGGHLEERQPVIPLCLSRRVIFLFLYLAFQVCIDYSFYHIRCKQYTCKLGKCLLHIYAVVVF